MREAHRSGEVLLPRPVGTSIPGMGVDRPLSVDRTAVERLVEIAGGLVTLCQQSSEVLRVALDPSESSEAST